MSEIIRFFNFFYRLKGMTVFYLILIMVSAAIFETMGVTMFLPIIEGQGSDSPLSKIISSSFEICNLDYSFGKLLIIMIVLFLFRSIFIMFKTGYIGKITSSFLVDLRIKTMEKILGADYLYYLSKDHGYVNNAVTVEFQKMAIALKLFAGVIMSFILSIAYLSITTMIEPRLLIILLILCGPAILVIKKINSKTKHYSKLTSKHSARLQSILIQTLRHFKYLKATYSQPSILKKINKESKILGALSFRQSIMRAVSSEAFMPITIFIVVGILYYQVEIMGKEAAHTLFLLLLLYRAIIHVIGVHQQYQKFLVSVGSINVFEKIESELKLNTEYLEPESKNPDFDQPICFKNVNFKYPDKEYVLQDINLTIHPKTTVAFVGHSGAGKSTLVGLLTGILKPVKGDILLGATSYKQVNQKMLRRNIGYVTQEGGIFNDSIKNNISLWDENINSDKLTNASSAAHIKEFIDKCPEGYNELLGDDGLNISCGQRQRICIARELYKNIRLIIFDEATSFLDTDSECQIQKNIEEMKGKITIVLISHRLSTIRNSDTIFILKNGKIIEKGSYHELNQANGEFKRMIDLQTIEK